MKPGYRVPVVIKRARCKNKLYDTITGVGFAQYVEQLKIGTIRDKDRRSRDFKVEAM